MNWLRLISSVLLANVFALMQIQAQKIECFVLTPPQKNLDNVKKIALLDFTGKQGKGNAFAEYLSTQLLLETRGIQDIAGFFSKKEGKTFMKGVKTNIFQLVERSRIQQILKEQNFSMSDNIDASQAAQAGKLLGVEAIVTGAVEYTSTDLDDKWTSTSKKGNKTTHITTTRSVVVDVKMKIISVATGEILGNFDKQFKNEDKKTDEERSGLKSSELLTDECLKAMAPVFAAYFVPTFTYTKFAFKKIKVKDFKKQWEEAEDFLDKGDINRAFPFLKAIADADPYNAEASYNLGLIYEMVGDYEKSHELLKNAYDLNTKEDDYAKAFQRAEKNLEFGKALASMGIQFEKYEFKEDAGVLAQKVKTKGGKSDRYEAYAEAKTGSASVAKIPGDTEFEVLSSEGEWFKLKLLGGKEGWVHKSNVKN